jgi:hypothetical protein
MRRYDTPHAEHYRGVIAALGARCRPPSWPSTLPQQWVDPHAGETSSETAAREAKEASARVAQRLVAASGGARQRGGSGPLSSSPSLGARLKALGSGLGSLGSGLSSRMRDSLVRDSLALRRRSGGGATVASDATVPSWKDFYAQESNNGGGGTVSSASCALSWKEFYAREKAVAVAAAKEQRASAAACALAADLGPDVRAEPPVPPRPMEDDL